MIPWETFLKWQDDWSVMDPEAIERRRKFLAETPFLSQRHFNSAGETVRFGRKLLVRDYAYAFAAQLALDSSIASTWHRKRLLDLAGEHERDEIPNQRRWLEGLSLFDQAVTIAHIEAHDPVINISEDINRMIKFIIARLFVGGFKETELHSYHDSSNGFKVSSQDVSFDHRLVRPGLDERIVPMTCRRIANNGFTYMDHRIKDPFEAWTKIHRQVKEGLVEDPFFVNDRCGLMFVLSSVDELMSFAERLSKEVCSDGGEIIEPLKSNIDGGTVDLKNRHTSPKFKAAKMLIKWHNRVYEFQFMTFYDYLTSSLSLTEANHELYKLRQALNFSLPLLWPDFVYGIRWSDEEIRGRLRFCLEAQLGWRMNGKRNGRLASDSDG